MAKKSGKASKDKEPKAKAGKGKAAKKNQKQQKQEEDEEKIQTDEQEAASTLEGDQTPPLEQEETQAKPEEPSETPQESPKPDESGQSSETTKPKLEVTSEVPKADDEPTVLEISKAEEEPIADAEPKVEIKSTEENPKVEEGLSNQVILEDENPKDVELKDEAPKDEESRVEGPKDDVLKVEEPNVEKPLIDEPLADEIKVDEPIAEKPKTEEVSKAEEIPLVEEAPKAEDEPKAQEQQQETTADEPTLGKEPQPEEVVPAEEVASTQDVVPEEQARLPEVSQPEKLEKLDEAVTEQDVKPEEEHASINVNFVEQRQQEDDETPAPKEIAEKGWDAEWDEKEGDENSVFQVPETRKSPSPSPAPSQSKDLSQTQPQASLTKEPRKPPSMIESLPPLPRSIASTPSNLSVSHAFPSPKLSTTAASSNLGLKEEDNCTNTETEDDFQGVVEEIQPTSAPAHKGRVASPRSQYDVTDSDYQTAYGSTKTPTTTRAASNGPYSPANAPLHSPSVSEARTKSSSPQHPSYEYTHQPQPIPVATPHFAYPYPYAHLYHQNANYPTSPAMEHNPANVTPQYSPVMHPSPQPTYSAPFSQQQGRRASRSSRSQYDYYFGNTSQYRSARESMSQPTENGKPHINGERDLADTVNLLHRIQNVIPDLNKLVVSYREAQSQLSAREAENKQIEAQHEQALLHKEYYIEALQNQMRKVANEHAEECSKLKGKIGALGVELSDLQERNRHTEDSLVETQKAREELLRARDELEDEIDHIQKEIEAAREAHERDIARLRKEAEKSEEAALADQKVRMEEIFQGIRMEEDRLATERLKAREDELLGELSAKQQELYVNEAELKSTIMELQSTQRELDEKKAELAEKFLELDNLKEELAKTKLDLETKQQECDSKQNELEVTRKDLEETKRNHEKELETLRDALESQTNNVKEIKERLATMVLEHQQQEESWQKAREGFEAQLHEKNEELKLSNEEKGVLEREGLAKEERLQSIVEEMRQTHNNLNKDRERLKKTLHSLGEATDMKMKGDSFFIESFAELSRLIVEVSKTYFTYLPIEPPPDILAKIPSDIPQFLDNTPASRELRAAYVQHVISKTLTYRIFQPFLFTLGRRYDKADTFFQMLSIDIRRKSVRREAFWRQQTLKAAYTTSDAKQAINVVAAVIVDEIVDHIRHFTDPTHLDALLTNVRKIVKLAAETWRLARVERELITAIMPSAEDEQTANDEWEEFDYDSRAPSPAGVEPTVEAAPAMKKFRRPLLRMLPRIFRGAVHEDFLTEDDHEKAMPCTYLRGVILYNDSPSVLARRAEMSKKKPELAAPTEDIEDGPLRAASATPPNGMGRSPSPRSPVGNRSPKPRRSKERGASSGDDQN